MVKIWSHWETIVVFWLLIREIHSLRWSRQSGKQQSVLKISCPEVFSQQQIFFLREESFHPLTVHPLSFFFFFVLQGSCQKWAGSHPKRAQTLRPCSNLFFKLESKSIVPRWHNFTHLRDLGVTRAVIVHCVGFFSWYKNQSCPQFFACSSSFHLNWRMWGRLEAQLVFISTWPCNELWIVHSHPVFAR